MGDAVPAEQAALQASRACEARIVHAHAAWCAKHLAASARMVLSQLLGSQACAQSGSHVATELHGRSTDNRAEGLSNLEASPGLEAADEHLNRLGQAGSQVGSIDEVVESWLEEEAQLQSIYAGEDGVHLTGNSRPASVRGGKSEPQTLQQKSLLDFDEEVSEAAAVQPQAAQMDLQMPAAVENAHQPLPAYFGAAGEENTAFEGLLEAASGVPSDDILLSLEPEDVGAVSATASPNGELPSFFQPDEGTGLVEAQALEPEVAQPDDKLADSMLEQEPAETSQASRESGSHSAHPGSSTGTPQKEGEPGLGSYAYGASAAAAEQEAASQASTLSGMIRPLTPSAAQEHRHPQPSSQPTHPQQSPEGQSAIEDLQKAVLGVGRAACLRAQLAALSAALERAEHTQQAKRRAISRYEWMHEAVLGPAGVLGPPVPLTHLVCTPLLPEALTELQRVVLQPTTTSQLCSELPDGQIRLPF